MGLVPATSADRTTSAVTRLPALDGLRGICFALVFVGHAEVLPGSGAASLAMFLFFALSGFLITALLTSEHERQGSISLQRFFARRALRLVPALCVFLACWLAVVALLGGQHWMTTVPGQHGPGGGEPLGVAVEGIGAGLGYLTNWVTIYHLESGYVPLGHLWSLAVEEQFYLVCAPLLVICLARSRRFAAWAAAALALASTAEVAWIAAGGGSRLRIYMGSDTRAGAFLLGGAAAIAWTARRSDAHVTADMRQTRARRHLAVPVTAVVAVAALGWSLGKQSGASSSTSYVTSFAVDTIAAPLLVLCIATWPGDGGPRLLTGRVVTYLGKRSYALYLWHYAWLTWLRGSGLLGVVAALAASLLCAELSWQLVEARALSLKARIEPGAGGLRRSGPHGVGARGLGAPELGAPAQRSRVPTPRAWRGSAPAPLPRTDRVPAGSRSTP